MADVLESRQVCPNCDTPFVSKAKYCNKCGMRNQVAEMSQQPGFGTSPDIGQRIDLGQGDIGQGTARSFSIASLLIVITVISVLLGIAARAPGLAILLALLAIPPWVRTALVIRRQRAMGVQPTVSDRIALFMGSVFVTWVIVSTLVVSCCLTFCTVCIGLFMTSGGGSNQSFVLACAVAIVLTLAVAGFVLYLFRFWIRARWRRHTDINRLKK